MANKRRRKAFSKAFTHVNLDQIPGPRGRAYYQYVKNFQKDILKAFTNAYQEYGPIVSFPWPMNSILIYDPEIIKIVLINQEKIFNKGEQIEELRAVVGNGLATNLNQETWLRSRKLLSREFGQKAIVGYSQQFSDLTLEMIKGWNQQDKQTIDICQEMKYLTFHIACQTIIGGRLSHEQAMLIERAVSYTAQVTYERIFKLFPLPYWLPTPKHVKFNKHYKLLSQTVYDVIKETRAKDIDNTESILEKLVFAHDEETGFVFSDDELHDETLTLLLAGHETTAHALTWTLGLLAKYPVVQENLYQEIKDIAQSTKLHDYRDHPLLSAIMSESMRLYPSFPVLSRKAMKETQLAGHRIPKDTNIVIPIYVTQRSPHYWDKPEVFDIKRFLTPTKDTNDRSLPFGKGGRRCIAESFALTEMAIIIANIIQKFKIELTQANLPKEVAAVSLKPEGGMPLTFISRE